MAKVEAVSEKPVSAGLGDQHRQGDGFGAGRQSGGPCLRLAARVKFRGSVS